LVECWTRKQEHGGPAQVTTAFLVQAILPNRPTNAERASDWWLRQI